MDLGVEHKNLEIQLAKEVKDIFNASDESALALIDRLRQPNKKEMEIINAINANNLKKLQDICNCIVPGTLKAEDEIITIAIKKGNLKIVKILMTTLKFNLIKRSFFLALLHCEDEIADYLKNYLEKIK